MQLSAEVAELQKVSTTLLLKITLLGQRYIHRRGMSDLGLQFLEKSGDCFDSGQEWEKAVDVYSQIHNWKSVKEGMRVRTKIWEQECKFQSVMNDGTELIKREGMKRSLPPHVLKQNIPESVEQAAETITEYSKFLSDLNESEWELMEVNNGFEHVLNLAYCAQSYCLPILVKMKLMIFLKLYLNFV